MQLRCFSKNGNTEVRVPLVSATVVRVAVLSVAVLLGICAPGHCEPTIPGAAPALPVDQRLVQTSKASVGKEMWHGYGLSSGKLGCAAAVCNVFKATGVKGVSSAAVFIMRRQLLNHPKYLAKEYCIKKGGTQGVDTKLFKATSRPGDVLLAFTEPPDKPNLGPNAHCGFVGSDGNVYTNDWNDGIWKYAPIEQYFSYYPYMYVVRLTPKQN